MSPPDAAPAVGRPIQFDNSYTRLPERFYARLSPTPVAAPRSLHVNRPLAALLGIDADWLASDAGIHHGIEYGAGCFACMGLLVHRFE